MHELEMDLLRDPKDAAVLEVLTSKHGDNTGALLSTLATEQSIPYLAALRHTEEGLAKRARWEHTWDLQRREDLGESVGEIPVPPKYDREDYRDPRYFSLRGKLDVPRERFIAYPGAETDPKAPSSAGRAGTTSSAPAPSRRSINSERTSMGGTRRG